MEEILKFLKDNFDVFGVTFDRKKRYLILGLESKPGRDLDNFENITSFPGFQEHFYPKVKEIIELIESKGYKSRQVRYSKLNVKKLAIRAGIGKRGKNTLVINLQFGSRLRFVLIETTAPLEPTPRMSCKSFCGNCNKCIEACPKGVLVPYKLINKEKCQAYVDLDKTSPGIAQRCIECVKACPLGSQ